MGKLICKNCGFPESERLTDGSCNICHSKNSFIDVDYLVLKKISTDESFINAMLELKQKDPIEYQLKFNQFKLQLEQQDTLERQQQQQQNSKPSCPHCHSTNISKIDTLERAGSIAMFGIFSKKINKSYKCKSCGYTW